MTTRILNFQIIIVDINMQFFRSIILRLYTILALKLVYTKFLHKDLLRLLILKQDSIPFQHSTMTRLV